MNAVLWVLAGLLAVAFLAAGAPKLVSSRERLAERMPWVDDFTMRQVRGIGATELLGAAGLVLPPALGIAAVLAPIAATGLALAMTLACAVHLRRGDGPAAAGPSVVLALVAIFVAWGRFGFYAF